MLIVEKLFLKQNKFFLCVGEATSCGLKNDKKCGWLNCLTLKMIRCYKNFQCLQLLIRFDSQSWIDAFILVLKC